MPFLSRDSSPYQGDWSSPSFQSGHCKSANTFTSLLEYTNKNLARVRTSACKHCFPGTRVLVCNYPILGRRTRAMMTRGGGVLSSQKRSGTHVRSSQTYSTLMTCVQYRHGGGGITNRLQSRAVHGERQPRIVVRNVRVSSKCEAPTSVVIGTCVVGNGSRLAARHFLAFSPSIQCIYSMLNHLPCIMSFFSKNTFHRLLLVYSVYIHGIAPPTY